jgi:hypothetical protein
MGNAACQALDCRCSAQRHGILVAESGVVNFSLFRILPARLFPSHFPLEFPRSMPISMYRRLIRKVIAQAYAAYCQGEPLGGWWAAPKRLERACK